MKRALLFILFIGVSGCTWPHYEGGGMDEVYVYARVDKINTYVADDFMTEEEIALENEKRRLLAEKLDEMKAQIAVIGIEMRPTLPGRVSLIEIQWGRAARTYAGNMLDDTMQDIALLEQMIHDIKKLHSPAKPVNAGLTT